MELLNYEGFNHLNEAKENDTIKKMVLDFAEKNKKSSSKRFNKEMENSLNETIKLAKEKSKPIIHKAKKGIDKLVNSSSNKSKDQAIEELKKIKELLDLKLISQEEFDKRSKELKKIILDKD